MGKGGGGGGAPQQTTATTYQSNLPEYAEPYFKEIMARTQKESIQPYTAYTGDRVSDFSQQQQDVQSEVAGMTTPTGLADAQKTYGTLANQTFDAATAKAGMDPYMQAVVDQQKQAILKDYNRQANVDAAQAVKAGAFGGGREGAERAVSQSEMLGRMADVQAQGLQQAYATSREQFNQQQQQQLAVAKAQEASAQTQQNLDQARLQLQNAVGAEQKAQAQAALDQAYNDFVNARDFERQQIAFYNSVMRGIPVTAQQEVIQSAPGANPMSQLAGLGIAGLGAYNKLG
jgi:hypothetical protein